MHTFILLYIYITQMINVTNMYVFTFQKWNIIKV